MKIIIAIATLFVSASLSAEPVFRIEVGNQNQPSNQSDLQRRVWELERAVHQLQARVFQLEGQKPTAADSWICKVTAMGTTYSGTGGSKAVASDIAIKACTSARGGDGFFCKDPKCEQ